MKDRQFSSACLGNEETEASIFLFGRARDFSSSSSILFPLLSLSCIGGSGVGISSTLVPKIALMFLHGRSQHKRFHSRRFVANSEQHASRFMRSSHLGHLEVFSCSLVVLTRHKSTTSNRLFRSGKTHVHAFPFQLRPCTAVYYNVFG